MKIPYVNNDATNMIKYLVDVDRNMDCFISIGIVEEDLGSYAANSNDMCNYSTAVIGKTLIEFCEEGQLLVKEGVFGMIGNHTWLEIEDIIIDGTLRQFVQGANKLSLIDNSFKEYQEVRSYTFNDWLENSSNLY